MLITVVAIFVQQPTSMDEISGITDSMRDRGGMKDMMDDMMDSDDIDDMMDQMRGNDQKPTLNYLGVIFPIFAVITLVGIGVFVYFIALPKKGKFNSINQNSNIPKPSLIEPNKSYSAVYKTLKFDEKKVLEVLTAHDGKYLQKYIRKEAELSRLKVHRILARLTESGVVSMKKSGNTNEVILADWLNHNHM
jgi:hypothetical protein